MHIVQTIWLYLWFIVITDQSGRTDAGILNEQAITDRQSWAEPEASGGINTRIQGQHSFFVLFCFI